MSKNKKPDQLGFVFSTNPDFNFQPEEPEQVDDLPLAQQPLKIWLDRTGRHRHPAVGSEFIVEMSSLPTNPVKPAVLEEKIHMKKSIFLVFVALCFFTCKDSDKLDLPEGTPSCIRDEVRSFKKHEAICEGYQVSSFDTQIGKVYSFSDGYCVWDGGTRYLDAGCNQICYIGGWGSDCISNFDSLDFENEIILWHN